MILVMVCRIFIAFLFTGSIENFEDIGLMFVFAFKNSFSFKSIKNFFNVNFVY